VGARRRRPRTSRRRRIRRAESKGEAPVAKVDGKVNINAASKADLMKLDGIGAGAAQKIIAYRQANGPFKRPQDLARSFSLHVIRPAFFSSTPWRPARRSWRDPAAA